MISLDIIDGKITYNELSIVDNGNSELSFEFLKEDMLQIEYPKNILLDVGWYPSFDPSGAFQVRIIKKFRWASPEALLIAKSTNELVILIEKAQQIIHKINGDQAQQSPTHL